MNLKKIALYLAVFMVSLFVAIPVAETIGNIYVRFYAIAGGVSLTDLSEDYGMGMASLFLFCGTLVPALFLSFAFSLKIMLALAKKQYVIAIYYFISTACALCVSVVFSCAAFFRPILPCSIAFLRNSSSSSPKCFPLNSSAMLSTDLHDVFIFSMMFALTGIAAYFLFTKAIHDR